MMQNTKPKIVFLTETHLTEKHDLDEFEIQNYRCSCCLSRSAHTGGVMVYVDDRLEYEIVSNTVAGDNWFLAIDVKSTTLNGIYGGIYHSPSSSDVGFIDSFESWLRTVFQDCRTNLLVGDFNIRWNEPGYARELKNVTEALGMKQIVSEPTRVGPSSSTIIDLVFTNLEGVEARVTEELKITDHETICIHVGETTINLPEQKKSYVSWKRYTKERLQAALRAKLRRVDAGVTVGEAAQTFGSTLATAVAELTDLCSNDRKVSNAWYGEQLRNLKTERDDAYRTFKHTKRLDDWNLYKVLRNRYVRGLRSSKNLAVEEEIRSCHGNPKKLWRSLKSLIRPGGEPPMEIVFEGARSERETAERLNQFFVKSVETIHRNIPPAQVEPAVVPAEVRLNEDGSEDLLTELQPITLTKLKETVYSLKDCAGVDSVTKRVMTDSFDVVGEQLLAIVNRSLESGEFPQPWKRTLVIPIPIRYRNRRARKITDQSTFCHSMRRFWKL